MLECKNLMKRYMNKTAVEDISLKIESGKIYALLGPNGSGKTTWMKMAAGLVKPSSGTILFYGEEIGKNSKKHIAYMSTEPFFYSFMNISDVGRYYQDFFEDFDPIRYDNLLNRMELSKKEKAKDLSSGMAAKLKIAVTLARRAQLFLLDEPLNGIDIIARDLIITTILEVVTEKNTVIMSSHLVDELEKIIHHAIFIKEGKVALSGEVEQIRKEQGKSIVDLYKQIYA